MESHEGNPQLPFIKKEKGKPHLHMSISVSTERDFFLPVERTNSAALHINKGFYTGFSTHVNGREQTKHRDG